MPTSLLRLDRVSIGYGDTTILGNINRSLIPGERIGLLGLNGAGKSTFIKLLAGELQTQSGKMDRAKDLKVGYFAQHQVEQLDESVNPLLTLQRIDPALTERDIRTYLGGFNFKGDKVLQTVGSFSGGEKARLVLALVIWQRPNLILLDEPTNHLDLEMRLALNQALQGFEGSVILVSHDRHLLRSVCDDLWLVDDGKVDVFDDGIDDYPRWLATRKSRMANDAGTQAVVEGTASRKQQKKQEADFRKLHQSKFSQIKKLETAMEKLSTRKKALELKLADSSIYQDSQKAELTKVLAEQKQVSIDFQKTEDDWLELSEAIELL
jgi:ATP-binding cassette subfamily F protein 3